jgi:hypothetical protein
VLTLRDVETVARRRLTAAHLSELTGSSGALCRRLGQLLLELRDLRDGRRPTRAGDEDGARRQGEGESERERGRGWGDAAGRRCPSAQRVTSLHHARITSALGRATIGRRGRMATEMTAVGF